MRPPEGVTRSLELLAIAIEELRELAEACEAEASSDEMEDVLAAAYDARELSMLLSEARKSLGRTAHRLMIANGVYKYRLGDLGEFVRNPGKDYEWDDRETMSVLGRTAAVPTQRLADEATGEIETHTEALMRMILECAAINYWRVQDLAKYGIQAKGLRSEKAKPPDIQLPSRFERLRADGG